MVPDPFLKISDPAFQAIPIRENHEPLVDVREQHWIMVEPLSPETYGLSKVRQTVAERLKKAASNLPNGVRFKLFEGYRPMRIQREYFEEYKKQLQDKNPDWSSARIHQEASVFVAPPDIVPPHTTGGAVDIFLVDKDGKEYDVGGDQTHHIGGYGDISHTLSKSINAEQQRLRNILITAMSKQGFVNYPAEWWHWSYGDRYWAYYTKHGFAVYGSVEE